MFFTDYALTDFLMFSPAAYFRRFELVNAELWPFHLLLAVATATLLWSLFHPGARARSWIALVLATAWTLVALLFLHRHYAQINLAANGFALAFLAQAIVILGCHFSTPLQQYFFDIGKVSWRHPGVMLAVYGIGLHPLTGLMAGRHWQGMEVFGISPDATVLVTTGILLTGSLRKNGLLLLLPLTWSIYSALTYLAMDQVHGMLPLLLSGTALIAVILSRRLRMSHQAE